MTEEERCGRAGCEREADYRIQGPAAAPVVRCRWHADAVWRPHGAAARVTALHGEVPEIDTAPSARGTLLPLLLVVGFVLVVVVGFAVIAPVMLD